MAGWLDALLGRLRNGGDEIPLGAGLNFTSGLRAVRNLATGFADVSITPDGVLPTHAAPAASAAGGITFPLIVKPVSFASNAGADDTAVLLSAPFAFTIAGVMWKVAGNNPTETWRLHTATGGGGSTLSAAFVPTDAGTYLDLDTVTRSVSAGDNIYVRRTVGLSSGQVVIVGVRP